MVFYFYDAAGASPRPTAKWEIRPLNYNLRADFLIDFSRFAGVFFCSDF
jgi:hypothetical protein